ncbi:protein of unknown function [Paraburkholderia dioscoreae]|uniref:Uncharacterized protein n=1 Tax=Paraburkholderia dioscoreae TaxID=2604047 RepID=A0A5Q4Z7A9_9BURK|nr:protein of unknown function [Paraburkholderia dioscoreae]
MSGSVAAAIVRTRQCRGVVGRLCSWNLRKPYARKGAERHASPADLIRQKKPYCAEEGREKKEICGELQWCRGPDLNRQAVKRRILSPLCLPISSPRQGSERRWTRILPFRRERTKR